MRRIKHLWKNDKPVFFAVLICVTVLLSLGSFLWDRVHWIESDDALVQGDVAPIGAPIQGVIRRVLVEEHQLVRKGQILCEIDPRERSISLAQAQQRMNASFALFESARSDFERAQALVKRGAISKQAFDRAQANFDNLRKRYVADQAQVEAEQVNLNYASVRAPQDGIVSIRSAQPGMVVKKGDPLFGVVYPQRKWVIAKIKETDLADLRPGQKVDVSIDAIPGKSFEGRIENFSPSTEGVFAAVPADNASGNFTKYVQRVPVRIGFTHLSAEENTRVRIGLSADIRVRRGQGTS